MSTPPRLRFRIATVLLTTALCGVSFSWWMEHAELKRLENQVKSLQEKNEIQAAKIDHHQRERKMMIDIIEHGKWPEILKADRTDLQQGL